MSEPDRPDWITPQSLRRMAEARIETHAEDAAEPVSEDPGETLHELRVHQAELEMQNEAYVEANRKLDAAYDRYRELFEQAPVGYVELDADGRITEANPAALFLLGRDRGRLEGALLTDLVAGSDLDVVDKHLLQARTASRAGACEVRLFGEDAEGPVVRMETSVPTRRAADPFTYRVALMDVTDRHRSEQLAAEREARLRAVLEGSLDAVLTIDDEGRIEEANSSTEAIFGPSPEDLVGSSIAELVPALRDSTAADGSFDPVGPAGERRVELVGRRLDGTELPVEAAITSQRRKQTRYTVILRDLTEQRRLEAERRESQKMDAVGRLVTGLAHDMNNLLMGLFGGIDRIEQRVHEPEVVRSYLARLRHGVQGGVAVVRRLVATAGGHRDQGVPLSELDASVRSLADMLRPLLGEDVDLDLELDAPDRLVPLGEGELEQILVNLAVNARDAMPRGGDLRIETRPEAEDDVDVAGAGVLLVVHDTGLGMSEEVRSHLFERFYTTRDSGTGLGMATVAEIVHGLGGRIDVSSKPDAGTTVTIRLPEARRDRSREGVTAAEETGAVTPRTILLVEDDELVRLSVRGHLEEGGHQVVEARDAASALEAFHRFVGHVDMLLADVVLPDRTSGPDLAHQLRQLAPTLVPVFMSAYPHGELVRRGHVNEDTLTLEKPFGGRQLLDVLRAVDEWRREEG